MITTAGSIADWPRKRLKFCATYNDEVLPETTDDLQQIDYIEISDVSLIGGIEKTTSLLFHEAPSRARRKVRSGDILISTVRTYLKAIAAVEAASDDLIASTGFCVVRPSEGLDPAFAGWVVKSDEFVSEVVSRSVGVSYPAINASQLVDVSVPVPPIETQQRIASFLDEKTAQIDALIEPKRVLLERLAEKRQAIITQAVTKGLKPAAPMKDSGIDWIGQIPAHWTKGNIRRFATMKTGHTPARTVTEYWEDCTIPWFTLSDVWQLRDGTRLYIEETSEKISALGLANSAAELLPAGTVIFSRTASIGFSGIMSVPMATTQDFWNWICGPKIRPEYLLLLFRAMKQKFAEITNGSTHKTIYQPIAAGLEICVPPLAEQDSIADGAKKSMQIIDGARSIVEGSVDRLNEYRAAVITAAVTGQIEGLS